MNKKKEIVIYKGAKTLFVERHTIYENDICPLCNEEILYKTKVYLVSNNYALFPDIFVHYRCVQSKKECIKRLISSYKKFKDCLAKNIFWHRPWS